MFRDRRTPAQQAQVQANYLRLFSGDRAPESYSQAAREYEIRALDRLKAVPARRGKSWFWDKLWPAPLPARRYEAFSWPLLTPRTHRFEWGWWIGDEFVAAGQQPAYALIRRGRVESESYEYLLSRAGHLPVTDQDMRVRRARAEFHAVWQVMDFRMRDAVGLPDVDGYIEVRVSQHVVGDARPALLAALKTHRSELQSL